jgi:hypothetical protein
MFEVLVVLYSKRRLRQAAQIGIADETPLSRWNSGHLSGNLQILR